VKSKIEALVQADFEKPSEIAGARDLLPHRDGSDEIESAWFHLDVFAALRKAKVNSSKRGLSWRADTHDIPARRLVEKGASSFGPAVPEVPQLIHVLLRRWAKLNPKTVMPRIFPALFCWSMHQGSLKQERLALRRTQGHLCVPP